MLQVIAFDADDTLWHNEHFYSDTKQEFLSLLSGYYQEDYNSNVLDELEIRNIQYYGYGIKSFTLSMVEAAIVLSDGEMRGSEIQKILDLSKKMLDEELHLLEGVTATLEILSLKYPLMLLTKGDLFEQHRKIARSGIAHYFKHIEIVADKNLEIYRDLLNKYHFEPSQFLMIGNSLRSDIQPVIRLGTKAIYIPYETTWEHENQFDGVLNHDEYFVVENIQQVLDVIPLLENSNLP